MKRFIKSFARLWDILLSPVVLISLIVLKQIRRLSLPKTPVARYLFEKIGVFPILDHWAEPSFKRSEINQNQIKKRQLPGIDLNLAGQLDLLKSFHYNQELLAIPLGQTKTQRPTYYYHNHNFESGDSEYYYNIIRQFKPKTIIEIGCGHSTLMAQLAIKQNQADNSKYACRHIAIEPYQNQWLSHLPIEFIKEKVEEVPLELFQELESNDILFIDSSHIIRPQSDVLYEFLTILPQLSKGTLIHIHDIFTPNDYLKEWLIDDLKFYNEQYLLEAFLSFNHDFKIIGSLNYLAMEHPDKLANACPLFGLEKSFREPGSFWIQKVN